MTRYERADARPQTTPAALLCALVLGALPAFGDGGVSYRDLARREGSGLSYERVPSARNAAFEEILGGGVLRLAEDLPRLPGKPRGAPGVAILDFDLDGDLDLYVTNGPGRDNSLFSNQLVESGELRFVDVGRESGAGLRAQDSNGVCYGDLDNDGDPDLVVLGAQGGDHLLENRGDGTFADVTERAGLGGGTATGTSCAVGDVDGDGLLDVAVANAYDWSNSLALLVPFEHNQPNRLWRNAGGLRFVDASESSGFARLAGLPADATPPPGADHPAGVSWAIAMVDYDLDGDVDVFTLDNRGSPPAPGGAQHGLIHLHRNDGRGRLEDVAVEAGLAIPSAWLGVAFGDLDGDGRLDLFATNAGDYPPSFHPPGVEIAVGLFSSRWLLATAEGGFRDPGLGELGASVSGWGAAAFDYDNDGDTDLLYHGGLYSGFFLDAGNPGVLLRNRDGAARFAYDAGALRGSTDHSRRNVQGLAVGDLDHDGLLDVVTVSSFDLGAAAELTLNPVRFGASLDATAYQVVSHRPGEKPGELVGTIPELGNGSLSVELARREPGAEAGGWIEVTLLGGAGLLEGARASRDGIGAVVSLALPGRPHAAMRPILGGSSYASQDALPAHFGLGAAPWAEVEVLWPGGARNRLRDVRPGERLRLPEIPCDVRGGHDAAYVACVDAALDRWLELGTIADAERRRLRASALEPTPPSAESSRGNHR